MILRHMIDIDETLKLTQSQGQGSRSIPAGKHFWKYKNVHLYQTGATDIFTRRKCPCSVFGVVVFCLKPPQKLRTTEPQRNFTGSYKKKRV